MTTKADILRAIRRSSGSGWTRSPARPEASANHPCSRAVLGKKTLPAPEELADMARRGHKPDPVNRRQVEALAGYGVPEAEIAALVGIDHWPAMDSYQRLF